MIDYEKKYGLSVDDVKIIDENIKKANQIFTKISKKPNAIKRNCESNAIKTYLGSL